MARMRKKRMRRIPVVESPPSSPAPNNLDAGTSHATVPLVVVLAVGVVAASTDALSGIVVVGGGGVVTSLRRTPSRTSEVFAA